MSITVKPLFYRTIAIWMYIRVHVVLGEMLKESESVLQTFSVFGKKR